MDDDVLTRSDAARPRAPSPSQIARESRWVVPPLKTADSEPSQHVSDDQAKKSDPLPRPGEAEYRAYARFLNRLSSEQRSFCVVLKDFTYRAFSYSEYIGAQLAAGPAGSGPVLIVSFVGTDVKISGRYLFEAYEYVLDLKLPWVWEHPSPHDFKDEKKPLISGVVFDKVERR